MGEPIRFVHCGDTYLSVELGETIDSEINKTVHNLHRILLRNPLEGLQAFIPSYKSLLIQYDPGRCSYERLIMEVKKALEQSERESFPERIVEVPVCYGGQFGPDIGEVASYNGLSVQDVIAMHAFSFYQVFMLGFTPGFCYLGELNSKLHTPRKEIPRQRVPAGSVGIADRQTGIYSIESPGGWQIIGRTPLKLFDPSRDEPFLLRAGDRVRFRVIEEREFGNFAC